jgi:hypothetical protein
MANFVPSRPPVPRPTYNGSVYSNLGSRTTVAMDKQIDEDASRAIAQQIRSKAKTPFDNAHRAAMAVADAVYVQGFVVGPGRPPLEHAWLEVGDRIVDPNLPHLQRPTAQLFYYAAQTLTPKQLKAAIEVAREDYPDDDPLPIYGKEPYDYYGDVMLGGKEYTRAHAAAVAKYQELSGHADRN